ncbi:MAG: hypothetical protein JNM90_08780 [Burkholderiales bacterium]|nr:hypothetical protein [Burkholderiales bacterium]
MCDRPPSPPRPSRLRAPVRRRVARGLAGAAAALALAATAQGPPRWWLGFVDETDRAFFELPTDARGCAERDQLVRRSGAPPGAVVVSRQAAGALVGEGARLTFGVTDLTGRTSERVMPRVVAIVREDERARARLQQACWFLAEAGAESAAHRVVEDRMVLGVHPPRALAPRTFDHAWESFGGDGAAADPRFRPQAEVPEEARARVRTLLPEAERFHVQPFAARLAPGAAPTALRLIGAVAGDAGAFNTVNLIVRDDAPGPHAGVVYRAGPSGGIGRDYAGSFVAQVVAAVDLDGDGVDELLLRARLYAGGHLLVLRWSGSVFEVVRRGAYEGE